mmetsp:Transcript_22077/g.25837  ORF Transcript_22077/g.25837 Transcript_22077/m.25837 type:complete len:164 (+) Transcript_22077:29-520(+)
MSRFWQFMRSAQDGSRDLYIALCMTAHLYSGLMLSEKFTCRFIGVTGPSMCPTLDPRDNLVLLDCFTVSFLRGPRKGEVIMAQNPFKPGYTVIKRVLYTEGEQARFYSEKHRDEIEVEVPKGHIWVEGDNKDNSNDSRHFGPISLALVEGIVRYRVFPFDKVN